MTTCPTTNLSAGKLAGDELSPDNPAAIAATGFLVAGTSTILNVPMEEEKLRNRANELDDMISTTCQALLGLTIGCARCHDHKYDPLPTRDYYRMLRVFNGGDRKDVPLASPAAVQANQAAIAAWQKEFDNAVKQRDRLAQEVEPTDRQSLACRTDCQAAHQRQRETVIARQTGGPGRQKVGRPLQETVENPRCRVRQGIAGGGKSEMGRTRQGGSSDCGPQAAFDSAGVRLCGFLAGAARDVVLQRRRFSGPRRADGSGLSDRF